MDKVLAILIANIITNNYILFKFMGLCPFLGVSKQTKPAISMGLAVIFVLLISGIMTWVVYAYVILPFHIDYMRTVVFILIIASSVQFIEMVILKVSPILYRALGIYLPLITTNCVVLGVTVINTEEFFAAGRPIAWSFAYSVLQVFAAGLGFMLVLLLMSGIRERLELADIPESLEGLPIAFIIASIMGLAFMGLK